MEITPLDISFDTTAVKTGRPIIADNHICKVRLAGFGQTKNDNGIMLIPEVHLLEPAPTVENGKPVQPGFQLRDRITLYDKNTPPGEIPERALTRICQIQDAFLGTGDPDEIGQPAGTINRKGLPVREAFTPALVAQMIGKEAYVKVKAKTGEYEGNDIANYIPLSAHSA